MCLHIPIYAACFPITAKEPSFQTLPNFGQFVPHARGMFWAQKETPIPLWANFIMVKARILAVNRHTKQSGSWVGNNGEINIFLLFSQSIRQTEIWKILKSMVVASGWGSNPGTSGNLWPSRCHKIHKKMIPGQDTKRLSGLISLDALVKKKI